MGTKKKWDLTSKDSCARAAEWIREESDALLVLVVRPEDMSFSVHTSIAVNDAIDVVVNELPALRQGLTEQRAQAKGKAAGIPRSGEATR